MTPKTAFICPKTCSTSICRSSEVPASIPTPRQYVDENGYGLIKGNIRKYIMFPEVYITNNKASSNV